MNPASDLASPAPSLEVTLGDSRAVSVTILLPSFEEEEAIGSVIDEVRAAMKDAGYGFEILVVDDASRDRTAEIAEARGVRVVRRALNGGSGAARKTGLLAARGDIIVMLDADGSYTAADIPKLLALFPTYDQVNGARTTEEGTLKVLRFTAKWMIRQLACHLSKTAIPDLNTGLKAFKREVMLRYLWVIPNGFSCVTSMTLAFLTNGHPVAYVPTVYKKRIGQSKFHPIRDTRAYVNTILRMVMYFAPLRIFGPAATVLVLGAIAKTFFDLSWVGHGLQESTIIVFVAAIMVFMLGLLADLIVAQKRQP